MDPMSRKRKVSKNKAQGWSVPLQKGVTGTNPVTAKGRDGQEECSTGRKKESNCRVECKKADLRHREPLNLA